MERRQFLKTAGSGVAAWTAVSADRVWGANDRLNVGLIGCGGRGTFDARLMRGTPEDIQAVANENYHNGNLDPRLKEPRNVDIVALCDVYGTKIAAARRWAPQAATYDDFRKLLADKTIDAVIVATHDPWHAQILIMACEAGKDVYLEKPVIYRVGEAKAMIEAVAKYRRIVQVGTQHRSADHIAEAARMVQGGKIGEVHFVRVWNYMGGGFGGRGMPPDSDPPDDLNWDAWLGPAPKVPFNQTRLGYRSYMDYTNGIISDYGNHRFDSVHQIMGDEIPLVVSSSAVRFNKQRVGDLYDMQQATYEYANFILSYEANNYNAHGMGGRTAGMRYYGMRGEDDRPHGMAFYGTEATLFVDRIGMELYPEPAGGGMGRGGGRRGGDAAAPPPPPPIQTARPEKMHMNEDEPTPLHTKNFVDHVRARTEPSPNIQTGTRASAICCIGNVAYWTGRKLKWDAKTWSFPGDAEANKYLFRPYRKPWDLVKFA